MSTENSNTLTAPAGAPDCARSSLATGSVAGIIFAVSNDGGKTGVAWRENVFDALAYLDLQNKGGGGYSVVAVRKPQNNRDEPTLGRAEDK